MMPNVLFATHDQRLSPRVQDAMAGLCHLETSPSVAQVYSRLKAKAFRILILDAKLPALDALELAHALRHTEPVDIVSWGPLKDPIYLFEVKRRAPVVIPRAFDQLVGTLRALLDPLADRTLEAVRYLPKEEAYFVAFRNGKTYELARRALEADDGTPLLAGPRIIHGGEAFEVGQRSGNTYQVPWDTVLYHQEPSYPYHKSKPAAHEEEGTRATRIGTRIRQIRDVSGLSLSDLANRTGIQPPNLSRLESGKHDPSIETLERVAAALGVRLVDIVAA
jgi:DNA-binding XRE family transcriptional regulator/CheY-like chemotaxis protein